MRFNQSAALRVALGAVSLTLLLVLPVCGQAGKNPKLVLSALEHQFGKVKQGEVAAYSFTAKNEGAAELLIYNVSPACGCTASEFPKSLAPGQEGKITLSINTAGMIGRISRSADVITNDPAQPTVQLWLHLDIDLTKTAGGAGAPPATDQSVLSFELNDIDGRKVKLSDYRGKVLLLVNVASKCGYTPQYDGLQAIYAKYQAQGFAVLGFPANNFLGQEPGTNEEIKTFCQTKYNVTFPMFAKISVKGEDIHPLYKFLTSKETNPAFGGDITWNFNKFLIDRQGKIVARFETKEKPEGEKITQAIEQTLKK